MQKQPVRTKAAAAALFAWFRSLKPAARHAAHPFEPLESRRLMSSVLQPTSADTDALLSALGGAATAVASDVALVGPAATPADAAPAAESPKKPKPVRPEVALAATATAETAPATVTLTAEATDADGSIARVDFFRGSKKLGSDVEAPFAWSFDAPRRGSYNFVARAFDDSGLPARSNVVTVKIAAAPKPVVEPAPAPQPAPESGEPAPAPGADPVAPPPPPAAPTGDGDAPEVSLVNPVSGKYAGPGYWVLRADASDDDGKVVRVDFFANGKYVATTTASPFMAAWENVAPGDYEVTAVAYDDEGRSTTSDAAKVTVERPAEGRTYHVSTDGKSNGSGSADSPVDSIDKAMSMAKPGDTVLVHPGTYREEIKVQGGGTQQKPIVLKAREPGTVIVDGGGDRSTLLAPESKSSGKHVWVSGITFRNADNGPGGYQAAVRTGDGWRVEDVLIEKVEGNGLGIFGENVVVRDVVAQDNGVSGISGSNMDNSLLLDSITRRNNTSVHTSEGGGGKITRSDGVLVDNLEAYENTGPGFWFDIDNINCVVRNSTFNDNVTIKKSDGKDKITGRGLFLEISGVDSDDDGGVDDAGPLLVENNVAHDNGSSGITVYATSNAHLRNNTIVNDVIELKDQRPAPYTTKNLTIEDNFFKDAQIEADGTTTKNYKSKRYTIDGNTYDNADDEAAMVWDGKEHETPKSVFDALGFEKTGKSGEVKAEKVDKVKKEKQAD